MKLSEGVPAFRRAMVLSRIEAMIREGDDFRSLNPRQGPTCAVREERSTRIIMENWSPTN
jgi:hypothetical protein